MVHIVEPVALTFLIIEVARLIRSRFHGALEDRGTGLTAGEARTLLYVGRTPGTRQTDLAIQMQVEPMTLVGFLDRLEARGLVERTIDPNDRRAKLVRPTAEAADLIQVVEAAASDERLSALSVLSQADAEALQKLLSNLRSQLSGPTPEAT